ncbi:MAG: LPS assembly lipoprotein LptE [Paracoccaceae bacterium]
MSFSRRNFGLALVALSFAAACGYTPVYGPGGSAAQLQAQVAMDAPDNRNEFDLVRQLEQRLGHTLNPTYRLSYQIGTTQNGVGVTPEQEIIRFNVVGEVTYTLTKIASGVVLTNGSVDTFTGFSAGAVDVTASPPSTNATIATLSAQRDANARLMVALADQIVTQLLASSSDWLQ